MSNEANDKTKFERNKLFGYHKLMKCPLRHLDMIKGRDGVGGFSMSENALPIFNQLIKLKICCCIKPMSRLECLACKFTRMQQL